MSINQDMKMGPQMVGCCYRCHKSQLLLTHPAAGVRVDGVDSGGNDPNHVFARQTMDVPDNEWRKMVQSTNHEANIDERSTKELADDVSVHRGLFVIWNLSFCPNMSMLQTYCQLLEIDVDNFEIVGVSRIKNHCSNDLQFYTIRALAICASTKSNLNALSLRWNGAYLLTRVGCGDEYDTKKTEVTSQALIGFGLSIYYHIESLLESLIAVMRNACKAAIVC
ncbi:hypothetical protein Tco_0026754 [Tanacetum coccineum]